MSALVYVSTGRGDDVSGDGTAARPVATYGRALELGGSEAEVVVDGMLGQWPDPVDLHREESARAWRNAALLAGLALACWAVTIGVLWLVVQALILWWQHPVGGALVCGITAIVGYVAFCKRRGISL